MEQTTSEVVRGARLAQDAGVALEEIQTVSRNLADLIQNISNAARQQAASADHISNTMGVIPRKLPPRPQRVPSPRRVRLVILPKWLLNCVSRSPASNSRNPLKRARASEGGLGSVGYKTGCTHVRGAVPVVADLGRVTHRNPAPAYAQAFLKPASPPACVSWDGRL